MDTRCSGHWRRQKFSLGGYSAGGVTDGSPPVKIQQDLQDYTNIQRQARSQPIWTHAWSSLHWGACALVHVAGRVGIGPGGVAMEHLLKVKCLQVNFDAYISRKISRHQ